MIPQISTSRAMKEHSESAEKPKQTKKQVKNGVGSDGKRRASLKQRRSEENIVQWKQKNIKDGFVVVDEAQLTKLIKREPIEKYYRLEQEPFAKGLFASVRRCQSLESGENFAAKFSSRRRYGEDCSAEIYHEIALLSLCGSAPRVIQIHDVFENANEIILVMEYAPGGDLQTIIDDNMVPFESDVVSFIRQTVEGLDYLHRRKIAHLDIKPQNIVMMGDFPNCEIKLCDFEISRVILEGTDIREILGTPDYVAPEILHYDPITLAADMWSLGVTTYVLLTGFSPFGGETDQETFCNISRGEVDLPEELFEDISEDALDFIKSLLVKDPSSRLTASACLKHPWLTAKTKPSRPETPQPLVRHDSEPTPEVVFTRTRSGCQTCQPSKEEDCKHESDFNQRSLRKYLSKSREALFEKAIQQHRNNNNLRKHTIKNQFFSKTRLCESQISLVSKSREKLLNNENLTPSFSRSIEKIYGLRSLSKSQEVLNLYRNGSLLTSQENINIVSEILKSRENLMDRSYEDSGKDRRITRATTADIGVVRHRHKHPRMYSASSTTSIASLTADVQEEEDEQAETVKDETENHPSPTEQKQETKDETNVFKEIEKLEKGRMELRRNSEEEGAEEPRFTVAQLITAYNKHQEIVTKTSLEVTMTAHEKEVKIPPIIPYKSKAPFPTGPTALRLFIPDIDLIEMPKKSRVKYKIRFVEDKSDTSEPNSGEWSRLGDIDKTPDGSRPTSNEFEFVGAKKEEKRPEDNVSLNFLRSSSVSSEASTTISMGSSNSTTGSSWEELSTNSVQKEEKKEPKPMQDEPKSPKGSKDLSINQRRSKSTSPCPVKEVEKKETVRKLSAGSYAGSLNLESKKLEESPKRNCARGGKKEADRSPNTTRKIPTERSPVNQRKSTDKIQKSKPDSDRKVSLGEKSPNPSRKVSEVSSNFKIVGIGEKSPNLCRKNCGISYKIEFDSPVVTRKFPVRNSAFKSTISSNLKTKDHVASSNVKTKKK